MHVKTDIFCGASLILPDKVGRQISVAGWSLDSTFGVRLYTPDGSEGVNGTNDWQENYRALKLQVRIISLQRPLCTSVEYLDSVADGTRPLQSLRTDP